DSFEGTHRMSKLRVGIIGYGYWGPNLVRNFSSCPLTEVAAVCDTSPARLEVFRRNYGHLMAVASVDELLELPLEAVAIATPPSRWPAAVLKPASTSGSRSRSPVPSPRPVP